MEFKEGGAFDFASTFERLKERLRQAVDTARESGTDCGEDGRVNMNNVHLEDLPAYEDTRQHTRIPDPLPSPPLSSNRPDTDGPVIAAPAPLSPRRSSTISSPREISFSAPSDPPPGYEEVQRNSIVDELERRLRDPRRSQEDSR
jgi:WW domain-binding protein 2